MSLESFNESLYDKLSLDDRNMIKEYMPKMSAGEINSFMQRLLDHYQYENDEIDVEEDKDTVVVFEDSKISQPRPFDYLTATTDEFINYFTQTTRSEEKVNEFFANELNYKFAVSHPEFFKLYSPAFTHIFKYFKMSRTLKELLQSKNDLRSYVWEASNAFFTTQKTSRSEFYSYIGSIVSRKLRSLLEFGYVCPYCSSYYTRNNASKKALIHCDSCKNSFTRASVRCPEPNCNKIVPLSSIDKSAFDASNVKHMRALNELLKYVDTEGLNFISNSLGVALEQPVDQFKITIAKSLKRKKVRKLKAQDEDYATEEDTVTNVPELLFCLPIVCPVSTGPQRKARGWDTKPDGFKGCGTSFVLRNGLRKVAKDDLFIYRVYDHRRVRSHNLSKIMVSYDEMVKAGQEFRFEANDSSHHVDDNKIPFEKIMNHISSYFNGVEDKKNKSMGYFHLAMKKYFQEQYSVMVQFIIDDFISRNGNISQNDIAYVSDLNNFVSDSNLQNTLFYKAKNDSLRVGWIPSDEAKTRIRQIYISLAEDSGHVRKIDSAQLPMKFYTYRISQLHDKPKSYRTRIGIVIDKNVLPATSRAEAGYEPNSSMDLAHMTVSLITPDGNVDISSFVKNAGYWTSENAMRHGFDNRTGIIWFNGEDLGDNSWRLPNGLVVGDNDNVVVSLACTSGAFSKMAQRFNLNERMREIVEDLIEDE